MLLNGNGDARDDVPNRDDADDEATYQNSIRDRRRHTVMIGTIVSSRLLQLLATPSSTIFDPGFLEAAIHVLALFFWTPADGELKSVIYICPPASAQSFPPRLQSLQARAYNGTTSRTRLRQLRSALATSKDDAKFYTGLIKTHHRCSNSYRAKTQGSRHGSESCNSIHFSLSQRVIGVRNDHVLDVRIRC